MTTSIKKIKHLDLFSGMGGFSISLEKVAKKHNCEYECIAFSDIKLAARKALANNFPDIKNIGDITKVVPEDIEQYDILTAGFPCQPFSAAGVRGGFNDHMGRGEMFFYVANILQVSSDINWITHNSIINDYLVKIFNLFIICLSILDSDIKERNDIKIKQKIIINILKFIDKFEFHDIDNIKFEFKNSEDKENAIKTINKIRHQLFDLITEKEFQLQKLETNIDVNTEKQKEIKNEQQKIYYILKNKIKSLFTKEQNNLCKPSLINNDNKEEYSITVNVSVTKDSKSEMQSLNENNEENEEHLLQPMFVFQENEYKSLPNSGYSFDSLLSALYCFYHSSDFQEAIVNAANLCGDADTIAAITGQLAGAYYQDDIQNKYYYYLLNGLKYKDKHEKIINDV